MTDRPSDNDARSVGLYQEPLTAFEDGSQTASSIGPVMALASCTARTWTYLPLDHALPLRRDQNFFTNLISAKSTPGAAL